MLKNLYFIKIPLNPGVGGELEFFSRGVQTFSEGLELASRYCREPSLAGTVFVTMYSASTLPIFKLF